MIICVKTKNIQANGCGIIRMDWMIFRVNILKGWDHEPSWGLWRPEIGLNSYLSQPLVTGEYIMIWRWYQVREHSHSAPARMFTVREARRNRPGGRARACLSRRPALHSPRPATNSPAPNFKLTSMAGRTWHTSTRNFTGNRIWLTGTALPPDLMCQRSLKNYPVVLWWHVEGLRYWYLANWLKFL